MLKLLSERVGCGQSVLFHRNQSERKRQIEQRVGSEDDTTQDFQ